MTFMPYTDAFYQHAVKLIGSASEKLMGHSLVLGTAESCTGGLLAALCTEVPGSSSWFAGGVVSYANAAKESLLHVDGALIVKHGAVSAPVVEAMAKGIIDILGVGIGISISGIAGPGGGTAEKPVGTVWIGLAVTQKGRHEVRMQSSGHLFPGTRQEIRSAAVLESLHMLLDNEY